MDAVGADPVCDVLPVEGGARDDEAKKKAALTSDQRAAPQTKTTTPLL